MQVSRDVIRDLWALCQAGDASEDSRRLVDAFLAQDTELAATLGSNTGPLASTPPSLPVSHEAETLTRMKRRLNRRSPLRLVALALTGLAVARMVEHTTFVTSPGEVIALAIAAVVCWIGYGWHTRHLQRRALFTAKTGRV
jgi:hypothetical protein